MELLTQKQVYDKVGATSLSTNEVIAKSEAQNIASQKLKRITNDISGYGDSELLDQFECEDMTRNSYTIQVSYDNETWSDNVQLVFTASDNGALTSKKLYIKAIKHVYLISGQEISQEEVGYNLNFVSPSFDYSSNTDGYSFWPISENKDESPVIENLTITNQYDDTAICKVSLIQMQAGLELVYGDVINFTYTWGSGSDLDQATSVNCHIGGVQNQYVGFGTNSRVSLPDGTEILGFAGDNTGTGSEHALVDFDSISKYISLHGNELSSAGVSIKEALTDENGLLSCKVYLYTVWYGSKVNSSITLGYTAYKKTDDESFSWENDGSYNFTIQGVIASGSNSLPAYCHTDGNTHGAYHNPESDMTLSAVFTYYFNSGAFSIKTNKDGAL